jgi:hypothetical protein
MTELPLRRSAASWLRDLADRLAPTPRPPAPTRPTVAPLVRRGGRWWYRDELVPLPTLQEPSGAE